MTLGSLPTLIYRRFSEPTLFSQRAKNKFIDYQYCTLEYLIKPTDQFKTIGDSQDKEILVLMQYNLKIAPNISHLPYNIYMKYVSIVYIILASVSILEVWE